MSLYLFLFVEHQDKFSFLNQGDNPVIDGVNDSKTFSETKQVCHLINMFFLCIF